ncbi:MAG: hypothetical protein Q9188_000943 [Gyalolechia gomerana]
MDTATTASRRSNPGIELKDSSTIGYESPDEIDASKYQVSWANVMAEGKYLTPSIYQNVEVLILCWAEHSSDFDTKEEVSKLKSVLEEGFRYHVTVVRLDAKAEKRLQVQVNAEVAGFVGNYDGPNNLLIVYYAGHGKPGEFVGDLEIFGQTSPNDPRDAKQRRNRVVWNKTEDLLRPAASDVLEIFDCCYAGPASFTSALTFALESLRKEKPEGRFTTDELLRKIKTDAPDFPKCQNPVLSDREHKKPEGGRIMLHPLRSDQLEIKKTPEGTSVGQWNGHVVTLHFEFGEGKPSVDQVTTLGQHFNDLFERNTFGVHRIRWGGIRRSTFGNVAKRLRGSLRRHRARSTGGQAINTDYGGPRSSPVVATRNMELLSPQAAEFEFQESVGDESPRSLLPSSVATSDMEAELDKTVISNRQPDEASEKRWKDAIYYQSGDNLRHDLHSGPE